MDEGRNLLISGLEALSLPVDEAKIKQLLHFVKLIEKWNKAYNLTAIRNRQDIIKLHILDSLAISPYLQGARIIDIGTGAGLPGIPLAVYAQEQRFVLLDSNAKKTRFVQQAIIELGLNEVEVMQSRVEAYKPYQQFDTVICRAVANMQEILEMSKHLLSEKGVLLAMKGQNPVRELAQIDAQVAVFYLQVPGVKAKRCLVRIQS